MKFGLIYSLAVLHKSKHNFAENLKTKAFYIRFVAIIFYSVQFIVHVCVKFQDFTNYPDLS